MTAVFASTLLAFVLLVVLIGATAVVLGGVFVAIVARKGDSPVELSPRGAAICAITLGVLVGWNALGMLFEVSPR